MTKKTDTPDLEYIRSGMFIRFVPNTPAGEAAWRELAAQTGGTGAVFAWHHEATIRQIRAAGYSVRKAKPSDIKINELLEELI